MTRSTTVALIAALGMQLGGAHAVAQPQASTAHPPGSDAPRRLAVTLAPPTASSWGHVATEHEEAAYRRNDMVVGVVVLAALVGVLALAASVDFDFVALGGARADPHSRRPERQRP